MSFLLPPLSWACSVPGMGKKYDDLIEVEKIDRNKFRATISKKAGDLNFGADITVGYYPKGSEHRFGEYWKQIHEREKGENYVVIFDLKKIEGYVPFVQVFWFPKYGGLCGAYGNSEDLKIE
jgi:hypothetical protein